MNINSVKTAGLGTQHQGKSSISSDENSVSVAFSEIVNYFMAGGKTKATSAPEEKKGNSPTGFDKETEEIFKEIMASGLSLSKFYAVQTFLSENKDREEFEKKIRDLILEARNNSKAAEEALSLIFMIKDRAEKENKSPGDILKDIKAGVTEFASKLNIEKDSPSLFAAVDLINNALNSEKYMPKEGQAAPTAEYILNDIFKTIGDTRDENLAIEKLCTTFMNFKAKKARKNNVNDSSTKKYLKAMKEQEEFDLKIKEIMALAAKVKAISGNEDMNKLINELMNTSSKPSNIHTTDIGRLNETYMSSPVFA